LTYLTQLINKMNKKNRQKRDIQPSLRIYCEGEKTEPNYFKGYIAQNVLPNPRLRVEVIKTKKNVPGQLVDQAVSDKKKFPLSIFWVVYDRESEQDCPADKVHKPAYDKAQKNDISVAISNVCFEVWLLLHFQETAKPYNNYDDLRNNSVLRTECKKRGLIDYDKGDKAIFNVLKENEIKQARIRAERMNQQTKANAEPSWTKPYQWNPYTNVHQLLDAIDEFAKQA